MVGAFVGLLALLWVVVLVVDVADAGGSWLAARGATPAWYQLFEEGSPVEWLQSTAMVGFLVVAPWVAAHARATRHLLEPDATRRLLGWLTLGMGLMLLEDSGNIGERLRNLVDMMWSPGAEVLGAVRLPVLALAAAAMTWALWRHRAALHARPPARRFLVAGYATYAVMAISGELVNYLVPFYERVGGAIADGVFSGRLAPPPGTPGLWSDYEVVLMDYVYEESLELVAAALLLAGVVRLGHSITQEARHRG